MTTVMLSLFQAVSHTSISQRLGTHPPHPSRSRPAGYVKWPGATRCSSAAALSNSAVAFGDYGCQHCDHSMIHNQQNSPMKLLTHRGHLHPLTNLHNLVCGGCLVSCQDSNCTHRETLSPNLVCALTDACVRAVCCPTTCCSCAGCRARQQPYTCQPTPQRGMGWRQLHCRSLGLCAVKRGGTQPTQQQTVIRQHTTRYGCQIM